MSQPILDEIKDNIAKQDTTKARLVLAHLEHEDQDVQILVLQAFLNASPDFAVPLLAMFMDEYKDLAANLPLVREVLAAKILAAPQLVGQALRNPQTKHRSVYLCMAGDLKLEAIVPDLIEAFLAASEVDEIKQYIDVLGDIGDPQATNALSDFLYSGNRILIIAAIKALGQLGTPTAMMRLSERMGTDNQLDLLILDIFAKVQDSIALAKLNEAMRSHYAHLRSYAKKTLVSIGAKAVPLLTENLRFDDPDLQIHTLNVLGDIKDPVAIGPIRKLLHDQPKNANVRFAAYEALGLLPLDKGAYILTQGLSDPVEHVTIAAAKAIDRNFNEIMAAGIRNLASEVDDAERILKIAINAQAEKIFLSLIADKGLHEFVVTQLLSAHQDIRDFFYSVLKEHGFSELALRLLDSQAKSGPRKRVCAVDDSRMILNIYKATLHELGFEPILFEFPASAWEWLQTERPDIVLTDLNMPEITGIELCQQIRTKFTKKQLPVIMITTQNEVNDNRAALEAGINEILHKPFTAQSLSEVLSKYF